MRSVTRKTVINIYARSDNAYLYEMGLPVMEIDCDYDVDVQQRVPLSMDRESVPASYMRTLYAEVLNAMSHDLKPEQASNVWVREATSSSRVKPAAMKDVIMKRFGDKVCIASGFDRKSVDEALSRGYKVVYGQEMSKEEWANVREAEAMPTSSDLFGSGIAKSDPVPETPGMKLTAALVDKLAKECFGIAVRTEFRSWDGVVAQFGQGVLTFNVKKLGVDFFREPVSVQVIDLIWHELGHNRGGHTDMGYHDALTRAAAVLTVGLLRDPAFLAEFRSVNEGKSVRGKFQAAVQDRDR